MADPSLKVTRNVRGGAIRGLRIIAGVVLVTYGIPLLHRLLVHTDPLYDDALSPARAGAYGALAGVEVALGLWMLSGSIYRIAGALLTILMVPFVLIGHALTMLRFPQIARQLPLVLLMIGLTIIYTGQGEWSLIPFMRKQLRDVHSAT